MRIASLILPVSISFSLVLNTTAAFAIETTKLNQAPAAIDPTKVFQSQAIEIVLFDKDTKESSRPVRVRDADTKKIAQVRVNKLEPKSFFLTGFFIIQFFRGDDTPRTLEFLSPSGIPYFVHSMQVKGAQRIILFTTADQLAKFSSQQAGAQKVAAKATTSATQAQVVKQVREQTRQQEKTQIVMEEDQAKDRASLLEKFAKLPAAEKKKRAEQAAAIAKQGDELYEQQKYLDASKKYVEASIVNPDQDAYYYKYGVSLYKADDYNKSLAVLSLSDAPEGSKLERDYYVALNHLKLKDYDKAHKKMVEIRDEDDADLSPVASYFAGTIEMQQQKFPEARKSMEIVLDKSNDPGLDKTAEASLEQIDKLETFFMKQKEKFRISFFGGLVYDENVLNVATNNVATDVKAYRLNYGASILGFWFIKEDSDLGTQISVSDYYSLDSNFKANAALQTADPLEFGLTVPYNKQFANTSWNLEPFFRSIYMSPTGGTRKELIQSVGASSTLAGLAKKDLYLSGKLDYSSDTSKVDVSSTSDDQTGTKIGLTLTPTLILDLKGENTFSGEVSYLMNQSKGENYRYKRTGMAITYGFPGYAASSASARLDYSSQNYADASTPRTDTTLAFTLSANKDIKKFLNLNLSAQYNSATSPVDTYKYNKFVVTSLLTYTTSIFGK